MTVSAEHVCEEETFLLPKICLEDLFPYYFQQISCKMNSEKNEDKYPNYLA